MSDDKPFQCTAPGCGQRFTNEDHLAVHKHKHEMTLKFGPARNDSVIIADQTPTPTRFLKNCEEVGLFNELASPFDHDFKKATEDDIKKLPLDLSPLATPIIRNKIEEPTAMEAHRDSPLPHPESTTSDDKDLSLQPASLPTSTIVHPASLQVPNVLLATSEANVVIQQALPSPTSSSVITQVPSTNRPIVPVSGTFPVLLQLPNGQTMPVAIPASITNSSVHIPTTIPLVRPVTVVPNVPGIPGPPSPQPQAQPAQSEAKLKLKATLSQQLPQVTNGDGGEVQSSAVTHTAAPASPAPTTTPTPTPAPTAVLTPAPAPHLPTAEEPSAHSLQQPATSTTETPASRCLLHQTLRAQGVGGAEPQRRKFLERNRAAASRCRQKRKVWVQSLEKKAEDLSSMNGQLQDPQMNWVIVLISWQVSDKDESCEEMSVPSSPQNEAIQHSSISTSNGVSSSSTTRPPPPHPPPPPPSPPPPSRRTRAQRRASRGGAPPSLSLQGVDHPQLCPSFNIVTGTN
ncbi:hypothetical protein INR49_005412, partial [Caranx melampygus]